MNIKTSKSIKRIALALVWISFITINPINAQSQSYNLQDLQNFIKVSSAEVHSIPTIAQER